MSRRLRNAALILAGVLAVVVLAAPVAVFLIDRAIIPVYTPGFPVENTGIAEYRSHGYGGLGDGGQDFRFTAPADQFQRVLEGLSMDKTEYLAVGSGTSRYRLNNFLDEPAYWFHIEWARGLEHYAGPVDFKANWEAEMVRDPDTGRCLLKIWTY